MPLTSASCATIPTCFPGRNSKKYRYFYDKLTKNNYQVSLFGLPRFTPKD